MKVLFAAVLAAWMLTACTSWDSGTTPVSTGPLFLPPPNTQPTPTH